MFWNLSNTSLQPGILGKLKSAALEGILEMPTTFSSGFPGHCASRRVHVILQCSKALHRLPGEFQGPGLPFPCTDSCGEDAWPLGHCSPLSYILNWHVAV